MAPYAIAHMKIGIKLFETGYQNFEKDNKRVRVYLTNTLEKPVDTTGYLNTLDPALAEETRQANEIKKINSITIIFGNPPYAGHSFNKSTWIANLLRKKLNDGSDSYFKVDGADLGERNPKWLNDDYVKFIRFSQFKLSDTGFGIFGFITNHGYIDNPTFRGMRQSLMTTYQQIHIIDLHGNAKKKEKCPDGSKDKNVFDIQQGVAINIAAKLPAKSPSYKHNHLWGTRDAKSLLCQNNIAFSLEDITELKPVSDMYLFCPQDSDLQTEYNRNIKITEVYPINGVGLTTARDHVVIDFEIEPLLKRATIFKESILSDDELHKELNIPYKKGWDISKARKLIQKENILKQHLKPILYRPSDRRFIFYHDSLVWRTVKRVMHHMLAGENLSISFHRREELDVDYSHFLCTRFITEHGLMSSKTTNYQAPLYLYPVGGELNFTKGTWPAGKDSRTPNLDPKFVEQFAKNISLEFVSDGKGDLKSTFGPEDVFNYIYAVFHSPTYRDRYAEFLKIDFPRVPITSDADMLKILCGLGNELVSLHLMESDKLNDHITAFPFSGVNAVTKVGEKGKTLADVKNGKGKLFINKTQYFDGVPEVIWNFYIGGYQVCHKWLADRKKAGRKLSAEDIDHYHKIVVVLSETIKIMKQIDETITAHGGWPIK